MNLLESIELHNMISKKFLFWAFLSEQQLNTEVMISLFLSETVFSLGNVVSILHVSILLQVYCRRLQYEMKILCEHWNDYANARIKLHVSNAGIVVLKRSKTRVYIFTEI